MWLIDELRLGAWFLVFFAVLACGGCATNRAKDPPKDDLSDLHIDPDQQALPVDDTSKEVLSPDAKGPKDAVASESANIIPPTPTVDELEPSQPVDDGEVSVVPEPPMNSDASIGPEIQDEIGSGPQVRYVKAAQLHVRKEPNRFSPIVGMVRGGQRVKVKIQGGWARLDKGRWIRARWLVKKKPNELSDDVTSKALSRSKKSKKNAGHKQKSPKKKRSK